MKLTQILPLIKKNNPHAGATLLEIVLGSSLMSFVVGIAGFGLVNILSMDQKASAKGRIQFNANRALEFMTDEIKRGRRIESDAVSSLADAPDFTLPTGAKPIVVFQVPDVPQRIIYYTKPAENIWEGPDVIERWGPAFDEKGDYDEAEINNPETWQSHVLIDSVDNTVKTADCPADWQPSNMNATEGFNACVNSEEKLIKLQLATTADNKTWRKNINYQIETTAFARSNMTQGFTQDKPVFTVDNNKLRLEKSATNIQFEVLGGEIVCSEGDIPVTTNIYIDGNQQTWDSNSSLTLPEQPAGTTFDVESIAGNGSICGGHYETVSSNDTHSPQLEVLVNGDPVPDHTPYGGQNTIESFMQQYVKDGKINIAENQVIYLFELWGDDKSKAYFDLQDNVVLATVDSVN
ncbi:hypothetical protein [Crocosphaera sp.]|uniref:hypothetical protein n=1 Tax=Crocosphaera sp. TaxID=2729996 RepID=UPI003F293877|nr:hypothetical protein [Crocosphaera sp.]